MPGPFMRKSIDSLSNLVRGNSLRRRQTQDQDQNQEQEQYQYPYQAHTRTPATSDQEASNMGHSHSRQSRHRYDLSGSVNRSPVSRSTGKAAMNSSQTQDPWAPPPYEPQAAAPASSTISGSSDSPYSFLREFDTIFIVDDSTSMLTGNRWKEAENAIAAIAPICTQYDQDGIDVYFLNHRRQGAEKVKGGYMNIRTADDVREIFGSVYPNGPTPFGRRLYEILNPYMRDLQKAISKSDGSRDSAQLMKPLNIIAITDGAFTDDAESVIAGVAQKLDEKKYQAVPWQVGIQFFQIGNDAQARAYLQELDDNLADMQKKDSLRDIVDTVPWRGDQGQTLSADGILKCVLGAVSRKYDKREASFHC
ncbi:von Willebrand factor [Aspergillus eucalypticola CBS 122712]|uniref:von Willebrand factor n=1 Tax=Aspergillus eucalypticola (strain CBS 122712 / IBT 29274) TaxID=1448314 RepID=A0A317WE10_ASPEC|nr:von Willebrand factor [Aspergillus eucalypticola CBS 122712]PWY84225.1 von Willebrand factor [Aspergillus eucalypticola CBS 122712]